MNKQVFRDILHRQPNSHKYDYGHVLIVGGSPGMIGAPLLSGKAALRSGAGLVTIASTPLVTDRLEERVEEIMTLRLPSAAIKAMTEIQRYVQARRVSVMVIGPGLATNAHAVRIVRELIAKVKTPMIIDGGGLGAFKHDVLPVDIPDASRIILTPHTGEFQHIIGAPLPEGRANLKPIAGRFAQTYGVTLVLKGQPTYIAYPDGGIIYENTTGNPGLATAGTGDVLSGMIAALISQGVEPKAAAQAAVYLHGLAGDIAAVEKTEPGMIATDVIEAIPLALKQAALPD